MSKPRNKAIVRSRNRASGASRRVVAGLLFLGTSLFAPVHSPGDRPFVSTTAEAQPLDATDPGAIYLTDAGATQLWKAQAGLVGSAIDQLKPRVPGRSNIYAMAIAAGGGQQLFGREAHLALEVAAKRFGDSYRGGLLLSNGLVDITHAPLATQANMIAATRGLAGRLDRTQDIAIIYLAAHGSPDASLLTDLPNQKQLAPISSASVADSLAAAGIKRRIIIISACFSGSWIPALASADSIVIAAARNDRTSFGCDDKRRLTYFGEAFLEGPLAQGASLREAFDVARIRVARWEAGEKYTPSEPQVSIGRNMQTVWRRGPDL